MFNTNRGFLTEEKNVGWREMAVRLAAGDQHVGWVKPFDRAQDKLRDTTRHPLNFIQWLNPSRLMGIGAECLNPSYRA